MVVFQFANSSFFPLRVPLTFTGPADLSPLLTSLGQENQGILDFLIGRLQISMHQTCLEDRKTLLKVTWPWKMSQKKCPNYCKLMDPLSDPAQTNVEIQLMWRAPGKYIPVISHLMGIFFDEQKGVLSPRKKWKRQDNEKLRCHGQTMQFIPCL